MVDTKVSALTADTTPTGDDEILVINDPGGTPAERRVTRDNFSIRTTVVPCVMEVPEGTVAFPDIHPMTTTIAKKLSGFVMPDGATASTVNFKCIVPPDLHTTPAATLRFRFLTLGAVSNVDLSLVVRAKGFATGEDADVAFDTDEAENVLRMANANDSYTYYSEALGGTFAANDTLHGQIDRRPADADDDYTADVLLVGVDLLIDTTAKG